jgi:hypothetical protein
MIDDDIDAKLRKIQASIIAYTGQSKSFSSVVNDTIRKGLKR